MFDPEITRRKILKSLGLIPAAILVGRHQKSWALSQQIQITTDQTYRYIRSNGIPKHNTGQFPNRNNPNRITAQNHNFRIKLNPEKASQPTELGLGPFGVAVNGIPFEPFAAEFWNKDRHSGWQYEAMTGFINLGLDENNAHVQPNGSYHYHGIPTGLVKNWSPEIHSPILGYAADGFPIYGIYGQINENGKEATITELKSSWRLKSGSRPQNGQGPGGIYDGRFVQDFEYVDGLGDLDEFNGKYVTTDAYPNGTYAYFITTSYPYIPRAFAGIPDESFIKRRRQNGNRPEPQLGQKPPHNRAGHKRPPPHKKRRP